MRAAILLIVSLIAAPLTATAQEGAPLGALQPNLSAPADPAGYYRRLVEARALAADPSKLAQAEAAYEQLTRDYALERETWTGLGRVKRRLGKHDEAIAAYRRSIALIGPLSRQRPLLDRRQPGGQGRQGRRAGDARADGVRGPRAGPPRPA